MSAFRIVELSADEIDIVTGGMSAPLFVQGNLNPGEYVRQMLRSPLFQPFAGRSRSPFAIAADFERADLAVA